jgi:pilus assembly protein CpaE
MSAEELSPAPEEIRVLTVAGTDPVSDWMADVIKFEPGMAHLGIVRDLSKALESAKKLAPDVILVDMSSGILQHGDLLNRLTAPVSGAAVIVVALMGEVDTIREAMLYGAQGFLLKPFGEAELLSSVRRAYDLIVELRGRLAAVPRLPSSPETEDLPMAEGVAVYSPKGGVGCTTIAANLAVALRATTGQQVILVDGDLRFGDIDTALNITTITSIGTLLPNLDQLDSLLLERTLVNHSSGIKVLIAPPYLDMADTIRPEQLRQLMTRLSGLGEGYVVVDAWSALDDSTLAFLDSCEYLVVVTTPQVTALRDTHRFLEVLVLLGYDLDQTFLVLNHCYQHSPLKLKDVERAIGRPIAQVIGHSPGEVTDSLNRGVPVVQEYPNSQAARGILGLARLIATKSAERKAPKPEAEPAPEVEERPKRRGLFSRGSTVENRVRE